MLSSRELFFLKESNRIENVPVAYTSESNEGHAKAWINMREKAQAKKILTLDDLCTAQKLLMDEQETVGEYTPVSKRGVIRSPAHPIQVHIVSGNEIIYSPPAPEKVPALMDEYMGRLQEELAMMNEDEGITDVTRSAALLHRRFESIHPFIDGNGRVGRLIANYIFTFARRPLLVFTSMDRERYYAGLRSKEGIVEYFQEQEEAYVHCLSCENDLVPRSRKGIETDEYNCKSCDTTFFIEW